MLTKVIPPQGPELKRYTDLAVDDLRPYVARVLLGTRLRRLRSERNLDGQKVAKAIGCSKSKLSRIESGRIPCPRSDLAELLRFYGAASDSWAEFQLLAHRGGLTPWWADDVALLPIDGGHLIDLEPAAQRINCYETRFVPELLQTEEYSRAIFEQAAGTHGTEPERRVEILRKRQQILRHKSPPRVWVIVEEAALRSNFVDQHVRQRQFDHLLNMTRAPESHISLQIVRETKCAAASLPHSCTYLRFPSQDLPDLVVNETFNRVVINERKADVEGCMAAFNNAMLLAESPDVSRALLKAMR
ncbi:helix-turn-helix domain-containing protein [Nocardia asteroides]|uniref:helix-turn-helix domain-containing protein n=1 Tax=Nocardia asteroides TaxID=1824 RepID=UPI001E3DB48D|nr:helix-turn-helix transcriptional regulator [Nocardia asteroides]UGT62862.1 helix-turn-helix domain-containing protein [Nocardia asteroides]